MVAGVARQRGFLNRKRLYFIELSCIEPIRDLPCDLGILLYAPPGPPCIRDRMPRADFESGATMLQPVLLHRPLPDVVPDVGTGAVLARIPRLTMGKDVSQADLLDQILHQVATRLDLLWRELVAS